MKTLLVRATVLAALLALGAGLHALLAPRGLAWIVWVLAGVVGAAFVLELSLRAHRRGGERTERALWRAALTDPTQRPRAHRALRQALDRARRLGPRGHVRHARLAVAAAELHLADGRADEAAQVLARVPLEPLEPAQAAAIRLARSQAYLHQGDLDEALATLRPLGDGVGDPALDASLELLRATAAALSGDTERALAVARDVAARAALHDELWDEAKALEALALGEPSPLDAVRPDGRARLRALAPRQVRAWLA